MRKFKFIYINILLALILGGCREPFFPDIGKYENILVIDGLVTDQEGPHVVRLSRSYLFDEKFPDPEEYAVVTVISDDNVTETFTEDRPGIYLSSAGFRGTIGRSYKLLVTTSDEQNYESDWVQLNRVPEIDSVTHRFEERPTSDPNRSLFGMQVHINTHDETNETRYYRWEWTETWEFITPLKSSFYPGEEQCWKTTRSSSISIGTSEHLTSDVLKDFPIYFISLESNRLRIKYSSLVSQYSMSREAYSYWKSLQDITQNTGSLFDPTPAAVTGNIYNADDQDKPVLGIFQASAVTQQRIFIDRSEIPSYLDVPSGYGFCNFYTTTDSAEIVYYEDHSFPLANQWVDRGVEYFQFSNSEACFRCTFSGSNTRPEFWPDN